MSEKQEPLLLRLEEVGKLLGISRSGIYRLFEQNRLKPVYVTPKTLRVSKLELDRFVASLGQADVS